MSHRPTDKSKHYADALSTLLPGAVHSNFRGGRDLSGPRLVSARGTRVTDLDGNQYLDLWAASGGLILGHQCEAFKEAIIRCLGTAAHVVNGVGDIATIEAIQTWFPHAERVRFSLSGTETLTNAVRLARAHTGRQTVLRFAGHYHGSSDLLLGGAAASPPGAPLLTAADPFGTEGRAAGILDRECRMATLDDPGAVLDLLDREGEALAALVMEPVCVNGGGVSAPPEAIGPIADRCRDLGIILILDEVITGVRLGPGGGQGLLGIAPDLFVTGKAIANGFPISVLAGRADIMDRFARGEVAHGGTYNGYPLGLEAIRATLELLSREDHAAWHRAEDAAEALARTVDEIARERSVPLHVNRFGTAVVLHAGEGPPSIARYDTLAARLADKRLATALQAQGVLLCPIARAYTTAAATPADLDWFAEALRAALKVDGAKIARLGQVADRAHQSQSHPQARPTTEEQGRG
ncbi:aminotransferase class III-fold pyridoxal phosphate-dependent enzyme [Rhodospirillum sp. A1_3_36]|uniref:aminotransferase class III-fold pyridoxal phosphate-dependent enzyme n=1 Tax=Rhodospirillum sp. A1_3_36 TaxID=3391666 RepID=UPI0039A70DDE